MIIPGSTQDGHIVTLVYRDTLTSGSRGYMVIPGSTQDGHSYSGVPGYSDKGYSQCMVHDHPRFYPGWS